MSLNAILQQMKEASLSRIPPEAAAVMARTKQNLEESGIKNNALVAGDAAPDFDLQDWQGKRYNSRELLTAGPLVLSVYRGSW